MKNLKNFFVVGSFLLLSAFGVSQNSLMKSPNRDVIQKHLSDGGYKLTQNDIQGLTVTDEYYSKGMDVTLVYVGQAHQGIPIFNAVSTVAIKDGKVFNVGSRFISNVAGKINTLTPSITPQQAIEKVASYFNLGTPTGLRVLSRVKNKYEFSNGNISSKDKIPVKLTYSQGVDGSLRLYQDVEVYVIGSPDAWSVRVDAVTGEINDRNIHNFNISCSFEHPNNNNGNDHSKYIEKSTTASKLLKSNATISMMVDGSRYRVFPTLSDGSTPGVESPIHGDRALISDPANVNASPFGWHDTDGRTGAEFTITKGNNVNAYLDTKDNDDGNSPDGGRNLEFDFSYDFNNPNPEQYRDAAVTNLFYVNNMSHDVFYKYGFDEAAGNFQENNYGKGGRGRDSVNAEAQDGQSTNNANMLTPPEGARPRMQMHLWTNLDTPRDSDFDNEIIVHEYGHGVSERLVGGPSNVFCLGQTVKAQQGEGWSDWFGLMLTMNTGDKAEDKRGVGTFSNGQTINGNGLRNQGYSTSFNVNDFTYDDIKTERLPHGLGSVWATMLWDLTWAYIDKYGFSNDLYNGDAGNNKVIQLVLDGLKLQPCGSGFVDSRDALLAADRATTGGENACMIWEVFAKRGLGFSAQQGAINSAWDGKEAFDTPETAITIKQNNGECGSAVAELLITNFSNSALTSLDYSYTIDGGSPINATWSGNIPACQTGFIALIDSGNIPGGRHELEFNTVNPAGKASAIMYINDSGEPGVVNTFENDSDELIAFDVSGTGSVWERGRARGAVLRDTGSNVYGTNLNGRTKRNTRAYLVSQCYDLSILENSSVEFNMAFDTEERLDYVTFQYSIDGGTTWQILGSVDDQDWFNNGDKWIGALCELCVGGQWTGEGDKQSDHSQGGTNAEMKLYKHSLADFDINGSAEDNIVFRFMFVNNERGFTEEGVIVDDFVVRGNFPLSTTDVEIKDLEVFPNPTANVITIQSSESLENAKVTVLDITGRALTNVTVNTIETNKKTVNFSEFSTGVYLLNIENGSRKSTQRIIKK